MGSILHICCGIRCAAAPSIYLAVPYFRETVK